MSIGVPVRLANGLGNMPDAEKWMTDYDYLTALIHGNFTLNGGMEDWNAGATFTNPADGTPVSDSWTVGKSGTTPATVDVIRESTIIDIVGLYSMKVNITGQGSSDSIWNVHQSIAAPIRFRSETVLFGAKVWCSTANKVRVKISDGVTSNYSVYHTGTSQWQTLTSILSISGSASSVTITVEANPSDLTGAFYIDSLFTYVVPANITPAARSALGFLNLFSGYLQQSGGVLSGPLALGGNKITGLGAGSVNGEALRYEQLIGAYLALAGGTLSGAIAMGAHKITGLANGTIAGDALAVGQGIPGVTDGSSAAAGMVGQAISAYGGPIASGIQNSFTNVISLSVPAGRWLLIGTFTGWTGTVTWSAGAPNYGAFLSTGSASTTGSLGPAAFPAGMAQISPAGNAAVVAPPPMATASWIVCVSFSVTTPVYLVQYIYGNSSGQGSGYGSIQAVRI